MNDFSIEYFFTSLNLSNKTCRENIKRVLTETMSLNIEKMNLIIGLNE